jgi:hypothetical protein
LPVWAGESATSIRRSEYMRDCGHAKYELDFAHGPFVAAEASGQAAETTAHVFRMDDDVRSDRDPVL